MVNMHVEQLRLGHVEEYVLLSVDVDADSGVDGAGHSHPYSRHEPFDLDQAVEREQVRWATPIEHPGWRRAWGLFDRHELVGHLYLAGGMLPSCLHRVDLGMGIARTHRRMGGGTLLLAAAIDWARQQPGIEWIDLGVLTDNPGAQALYERHGFQITGRTPDRFRVDGVSLDDISMSLHVADGG
jgi:RimJ/RimL family protein N-acetyltransferase